MSANTYRGREGNISLHSLAHVQEALDSGTNFTSHLLRLIAKADWENRARLRLAFPSAVDAYERWLVSVEEGERHGPR